MEKLYYVYIMTNQWNTVLYTGMTGNLEQRVWSHKNKTNPKSFTARYNCTKLVWYEETNDVFAALETEKIIKAGSRKKKIQMINDINPDWEDLAKNWF
ncbi:MAG: GIY-YIG nuclease family protein [FCB group bacterium]|nr:GIY-YIG nuclease family protein [FCB group bacterium]